MIFIDGTAKFFRRKHFPLGMKSNTSSLTCLEEERSTGLAGSDFNRDIPVETLMVAIAEKIRSQTQKRLRKQRAERLRKETRFDKEPPDTTVREASFATSSTVWSEANVIHATRRSQRSCLACVSIYIKYRMSQIVVHVFLSFSLRFLNFLVMLVLENNSNTVRICLFFLFG